MKHISLLLLNDKEILTFVSEFSDCKKIIDDLEELLNGIPTNHDIQSNGRESLPTEQLSRILEKATKDVQTKERNVVTHLDIFAAIFKTKRTITGEFLQTLGIPDGYLLRYVEHGIPPRTEKNNSGKASVGIMVIDDNYTPMDYAVDIFQIKFGYSKDNATNIMMQIHNHGRAFIGYFESSDASRKTRKINAPSLNRGFPLLFVIVELLTHNRYENEYVFPRNRRSELVAAAEVERA